jgi:ketosteroid isomerase-like protein
MTRRGWLLTIAAAGMLVGGQGLSSTGAQEQTDAGAVVDRFIEVAQREDAEALAALMAPDVSIALPMSATGDPADARLFAGREATMAYFQRNFDALDRIAFSALEVSVVEGGATAFVEATGDFVLADGRPYRNVYVFRVDVEDGRIVTIAEYANPVIAAITFGGQLGPVSIEPGATPQPEG